MPHHADDHEVILFRSPELTIRRCSCGIVHLDVGPLTLRLEDEGFESFTRACRQASARLALRNWEMGAHAIMPGATAAEG